MPMPNRAAELMRMMQGTMGAGGAPQRMNRLSNNTVGGGGMMGPAPSRPQMDPQAIERLMSAVMQGQGQRAGKMAGSPGRGTQYAQQLSQRPQPGTRRTISNESGIPGPLGGLTQIPDYAGRRQYSDPSSQTGFGIHGLTGGKEMELQQNGYVDIGGTRYILDRSSGEVSQMPIPGTQHGGLFGMGGGVTTDDPSRYGAQDPVSLMEAIRQGR